MGGWVGHAQLVRALQCGGFCRRCGRPCGHVQHGWPARVCMAWHCMLNSAPAPHTALPSLWVLHSLLGGAQEQHGPFAATAPAGACMKHCMLLFEAFVRSPLPGNIMRQLGETCGVVLRTLCAPPIWGCAGCLWVYYAVDAHCRLGRLGCPAPCGTAGRRLRMRSPTRGHGGCHGWQVVQGWGVPALLVGWTLLHARTSLRRAHSDVDGQRVAWAALALPGRFLCGGNPIVAACCC